MIHHIKRATRHLIFWSLITAAIGLTGIRLLLSGIEHYKSDLAAHIGALAGTPVTIGRLGANMRGFNPQLVLRDITIASLASAGSEKPAIEFNEIRLGIDLLDMIASRDLLSSSWVTLVGAKLSIKRQLDGSIVIVGLKASEGQPQWLLQGGKYEILQSEISWQDQARNDRPLLFKGADLAIRNDGDRHRLNMLVKLPPKIGDTLRVSMDVEGNVFEPSTIQGRIYIDGKSVNLPELAALGVIERQASDWGQVIINSGIGDFKVWGDWRQSQLASVDVTARIQQLALVRQGKREFFVNELSTRLHWEINQDQNNRWHLDAGEFSLKTQDSSKDAVKTWPAAVFSISGRRIGGHVLPEIAMFIERLDLQEASELALYFAPLTDEQAKLLTQAQLKGTLENFSLFTDLEAKSVALNGGFANIGVAPLHSVPGIENLTGRIKGSEKQGAMTLVTENAWLTRPGLFREPLPVKRLQGALAWRQAAGHVWSVSSPMIELDSLSFQSTSKFHIDIPESGGPVFMDLQSAFSGGDAGEVKHYLPTGIMDEEVVAWLDRAFVSGRMTNGGLLVYGNLNDFPFTDAPGVFEAVFDGEQFDLSYDPEWPDITGMNAEVMFSQGGLKVNVLGGQSESMVIKQAEVAIPSLKTSTQLLIQGEAEAEIGQTLTFMQHTPLNSRVGSVLEAISPQGDTQVALDLKIPLTDGAPTKVDGTAQLKDAMLTVKSLALPVSKINGELKFNEQGVYSDTIQAYALGHAIQGDIKSSDSQTTVNVSGRVGVRDLKAHFELPWWDIAKGATDYQLKLELPYGDIAPTLVVESMLSGMSLDLPGALAKTSEQSVPLSLTFTLGNEQLLPALLNYDNKLKAAIQLDTQKKNIYSGHVLLGSGEVFQNQDAGLKLEINRDRLALEEWLGLASVQGAGDDGRLGSVPIAALPPFQAVVRELKIHSDHALWKNSDIGVFDLALKHTDNKWAGTLDSPIAKGNVQVPVDIKNTDRISLDMALLDISALKQIRSQGDSALQAISPELMPLLTVISKKTLWQGVDLGQLSLETRRVPGGIGFSNVELAGENQKLVLSGEWKGSGSGSNTHVEGRLDVPRAGPLLTQLGISKDLTETSATADFSVVWAGAPYQFSLAGLKGKVDVNFKDGRILSIEPGFGRILGMLALAQWIKRAQLDFSDIYQEGLTFNSIKGHFDLARGIASTHDLVVDAVPAKIAISGDTDLVNQTVDHIVDVTPKSADAVPIAGTIMGKVAALVGQSLTGKNQEGFFFGSQYLVKGPWSNAQVIPMHKNDGLLQKTWSGITDFPWLQEETNQQGR